MGELFECVLFTASLGKVCMLDHLQVLLFTYLQILRNKI